MQELPPGRRPVRTRLVADNQREQVYQQLREELQQGKQGYVVCPLVQESERADLTAAQEHFHDLKSGALHGFPPRPFAWSHARAGQG